MRHILILNPAAGKRDSTRKLLCEAEKVFGKRNIKYETEFTRYPGHATEIARKYIGEEETILYACGGDGTLCETAQALHGACNLILAPVSVGTGNDFVRSLKGESDAEFTLTELVENGSVVFADMLLAGGRVALNIVSVGLDASVTKNVARFKRLPFVNGAAAYKLSTVYCFFKNVKYRLALEVDGEFEMPNDYVFAIAANGRFYGGGFKAAPLADIQDGLIDFISVPAKRRLELLPMIKHYRRGEHLAMYDFVRFVRCRRVRYISDEPVELNCDGEVTAANDPVVEVIPAGMRLLVPQKCVLLKK